MYNCRCCDFWDTGKRVIQSYFLYLKKKFFFFFVKWLYCILSNISLSHMVSLNWKVTLKLSFHMIIMNLASKLCSWASHYLQTCFIGKTKKNQKGCRLKKNSEEFFMKKLKWGFSCFSFC